MIDIATLFLTHGIMGLALWRLLARDDLDVEEAAAPARRRWHRAPAAGDESADEGAG